MTEPPTRDETLIYCHPRDDSARKWLLVFEDADKAQSVYKNEDEARRAFILAESMGWNCHLFESATRDAAHIPREPTAWLVELQCSGQCKGWIAENADEGFGWTLDPNKAIRFARKQDADAFRRRYGFTSTAASSTHLSTEHVWLDAAPKAEPAHRAIELLPEPWLIDLQRCEQGGRHDWQRTDDKEPTHICIKCKGYTRAAFGIGVPVAPPASADAPREPMSYSDDMRAGALARRVAAEKAAALPDVLQDDARLINALFVLDGTQSNLVNRDNTCRDAAVRIEELTNAHEMLGAVLGKMRERAASAEADARRLRRQIETLTTDNDYWRDLAISLKSDIAAMAERKGAG